MQCFNTPAGGVIIPHCLVRRYISAAFQRQRVFHFVTTTLTKESSSWSLRLIKTILIQQNTCLALFTSINSAKR